MKRLVGKGVVSNKVYNWPEFKAFAARLGIDTDKATKKLYLELEMNELANIKHEYYAEDKKEGEE